MCGPWLGNKKDEGAFAPPSRGYVASQQHPQLQLLLQQQLLLQLHPQLLLLSQQLQQHPLVPLLPLPQQQHSRMMIRMIHRQPQSLPLFHMFCFTSLIKLEHPMPARRKRQLDR